LSIIFPPENTRIFDHILFTFNWKRMGLLTSALLCAQAETTGQVSRTMQSIPRSQFI